ncbi:hypothetical protein O185_24000 [Photorhabdus temperata J3]|uniref:Uncharacterized protein n=1 Tax=Photorhabdus temperata J3 TaxID=1389415 RepID=U7QRV4_PHOTE|nr:hypothetical protein O185_24000 [Photorhabdus temperata J3]
MSDNKRHVHADSMLEYAIDASKTDKPGSCGKYMGLTSGEILLVIRNGIST